MIGVGGQLDLDELNGIVGAGNDRYLNHVPSFDDLRQVILFLLFIELISRLMYFNLIV